MSDKTTHKTARTIRDYKLKWKGLDLVIPKGSLVSNSTACGCNDDYRFWVDYHKQFHPKKDAFWCHYLKYYGINIPAEYCEPYIQLVQ